MEGKLHVVIFLFEFDGVQDMPPPNRAPGYTEYFKLKECEKTAEAKSFWLLPQPSPLKQVIKPSCRRCPPYTQRRRTSLSMKTKRRQEESQQTGLTKLPPFYYTYLTLLNLSYFYTTAHFSNLSYRYSGWTVSSGFLFLMKALVSQKITLNKAVCFSPVHLSLLV